MNDRDVTEALSLLVAGTTGWTDESVDLYCDELGGLSDRDALIEAIRSILRHWHDARRPPLARILDEYRAALRRREHRELERGGPDLSMPVDRGISIAYEAYSREARRQGREPRPFDRFKRTMPVDRRRRRA